MYQVFVYNTQTRQIIAEHTFDDMPHASLFVALVKRTTRAIYPYDCIVRAGRVSKAQVESELQNGK